MANQYSFQIPSKIVLILILLLAPSWFFSVPFKSVGGSFPLSTASSPSTLTEDIPILAVTKRISETEAKIHSRVLVEVVLENIGLRDALDITIKEPTFTNGTFILIGAAEYSFNRIAVNDTRVFAYSLEPLIQGYYQIEESQITYENEDGHQFQAFSNSLELFVVEKQPTEEEEPFEWYHLLSIACIVWIILLLMRALLVRRSSA
ncbi:MAG: hypothetical protein ACE5OZ_16525 [Candidatus Heimdallarchaeota archaeon]